LVLSFCGVGLDRNLPVPLPEAADILGQDGENHVLFIADASRSWMNAPGLIEALKSAVAGLVDKIKPTRIVAFGNSMGGSAAMIYAAEAPVDAVLAIVPQYSVHPDEVPNENRWTHFRDHILDWRYRTVPKLAGKDVQVLMLNGGSDPRDVMHARKFAKKDKLEHYVVPQYAHALALCLKNTGYLAPLTRHVINGDLAQARQVIQAAGGIPFDEFWQQRSDARKERRSHAAV
jgi:hypothetical protein